MNTTHTDGQITIRPVSFDDAHAMFEAAHGSIAEIYPWMEWCHPEYSFDEARAWLAYQEAQLRSMTEYTFAIIENSTGAYLGNVGLSQLNGLHRFANLGYWVRTDRTGEGIATAATILTAQFGLDELALERIEILVSVGNVASQRVAERSGAVREGVLRRRLVTHGEAHDAVMFSIVRSA